MSSESNPPGMEQHPPTPGRTTLPSQLTLLALIAAGIAGNYFSVPLFFGVDFLFGSVAVLAIAVLYGPAWGTTAALLAGSYTYVLWNHPYAAVILTLEALFVGLVVRRRPLPLADGLFWLLVGMPLAWLFYRGIMKIEAGATLLVMLKQSVNGIFNALLAGLLLTYVPRERWIGHRTGHTVSLQEMMFNVLTALVLIPSLLLMIQSGQYERAQLEIDIRQQLQDTSGTLANRLEVGREREVRAVETLARVAAANGVRPQASLQQATEVINLAFPEFHNVYIADAGGTTVAFHPAVNERGESNLGINFADRPYFQQLKRTLQPVTSEVFPGRGGVFSPIVTISVPVVRENRFAGFALAAIDLGGLRSTLARYMGDRGFRATLVDNERRVIASTRQDLDALERFSFEERGELQSLEGGIQQWAPHKARGTPPMTRWRESLYLMESQVQETSWSVIVEAPIAPYQRALEARYVNGLTVTLTLALLALLLASALSRSLTTPLSLLAHATRDLPENLAATRPVTWPRTRVAEIASLIGNFRSMLQTLQMQFQALQQANQAIAERTEELAARNAELQQQAQVRQEVEAALRVSETRFRMLVEQSPIAIQIFSRDGEVLQANHAWEQLWNTSVSELAGYNVLQDAQLRAKGVLREIERAFKGEVVTISPVLYDPAEIGKVGEPRWVGAFLYPVRGASGDVGEVVLMLQDSTEQMRIERERAELLSRELAARESAEQLYLEAADAARRKDEFLAMLAHELRNPLGAVSNALHVLRQSGVPDARAGRALEVLDRQVRHQQRMVDDLLDVSRITRGLLEIRREPLDLREVVRHAVDDQRAAVDAAGLSIELELPPDPAGVIGDPTRLAQVLSNLLHNAVKFTPSGGAIRVAVRVKDQTVTTSVYNTGTGVSAELLPRIFDAFTQADHSLDRSQGGLGLGLALVKGLVELHGGRVRAESAGEGRGAEFLFELPQGTDPLPAGAPEPAAPETQQPKRVLVIEDNRDAAETMQDLLELSGHEVALAFSGPEGLQKAREFHPQVVLCDIGLPGMDGYRVAEELVRDPETQSARLIAVSGYGSEEHQRRSRAAGFEAHLTKPLDPAVLQRLLVGSDENEPAAQE